jgi:rubrerythrin
MERKERINELLKKQIDIENDHVRRLKELEKKVGTAAARLLLIEMQLDSTKHAAILSEIIEIMNKLTPSQTLWSYKIDSYVDKQSVKKELENHVKMESDVMAHVEEEIRQTKDEGLKLLLEHIAADEKKHHQILETIVKYSYKIKP